MIEDQGKLPDDQKVEGRSETISTPVVFGKGNFEVKASIPLCFIHFFFPGDKCIIAKSLRSQ